MRHLHLGRSLGRLLAALLFLLLLAAGVSCNGYAVGPDYIPIPPPATFGSPTSEIDSAGVTHTYWSVTSPASPDLSDLWVYLTNVDMGSGTIVRAARDGSYATRIEGHAGDWIMFGFGAPYGQTSQTMCRTLREGLADVACQ